MVKLNVEVLNHICQNPTFLELMLIKTETELITMFPIQFYLHLGTYVDTQAFLVQEISGRAIRIEFAKRFKKPSPPRPEGPPAGETRHKLYVSNLAWKVRSTHLRELVSENFKPVSARVVFDAPLGRSAGYGFVSFATREEAEAVISALEGKVKKNYLVGFPFMS
jgi:hypothetical protein